ncbi:hypothetical protein B0H13DRAFT_2320436 [Mycena leptocephala]|nr:hypothetical protein B0H13DRAFT_2320436 [Mycena leptocephala]
MFSSALVLLALAASPVVSLVCGRRYSTLLSRQSEDYNFYSLNPGRIKTDLMIGDMDGDGNRKPRQNCIFYVNQKDVDENDPNYAKNRAVQFADLMNAANPGSDYHTLYDVYDSAEAFNYGDEPMLSALSSGNLRNWFEITSGAYADLCEGTLYLVVEAEPQDIWPQSIWLTHEWPAIQASRQVTQVTEIRPEDVGQAVAHNGNTRYIRHYPYRGGQPPGATPPRDDDSSEIPGNINIDPNASNQKFAGIVDVSGDISPFKEGWCTMHVHQWKNPRGGGGSPFDPPNSPWTGPFSVEITMWDNHVDPNPGNKIGFVARTNANDPNALHMASKLDLVLIVTPEEEHDYIQFNLGALSFTSKSNCRVGGWNHNTDRQMDCGFPCVWGGGDSTDHTEIGVYYP